MGEEEKAKREVEFFQIKEGERKREEEKEKKTKDARPALPRISPVPSASVLGRLSLLLWRRLRK